ncbi:hypothetical protein HK103_003748 [Boothiomyces macroporosus]|uniref:Major facilitator superfamily (MFS) profile domain-containing protein n=1 Tax=Boothiomyces macroporosus TaxID=261099 RepID=A0AAD5UHH7_9FUNG|nr:hypothetical protein HK103_003748 [Boothiomyces macroporosus]
MDGQVVILQETTEKSNNRLGFWKFSVGLRHSYTSLQIWIYLLGVAMTIALFVFLNSTQGFVLKEILNYPTDNLGYASGSLVFYDELLSLFMVAVWGILSDLVDRFSIFGLGFLFSALGLGVFTYASNLYPQLLLFRLVFAIGGSACSAMLTAILSDVVLEQDRGKLSGITGLMSGAGALLGVFLFLPLPAKFGDGPDAIHKSYLIVAGVAIFIATLLFAVSIARYYQDKPLPLQSDLTGQHSDSGSSNEGLDSEERLLPTNGTVGKLWDSISLGFSASKNPNILMGHLASFLARGDSLSLTLFIPLWVYQYYLVNGLCNTNTSPENADKDTCNEAYIKASILSGVAQTFALVGAPIFGYLSDKIYRPFALLFASVLAAIGYLLLSLQQNPIAGINFLFLFLVGFGEIGLIIVSLGLVTHTSVPNGSKGSVAGIASFSGALGILVISKLGGYLFDSWFPGAPFLLLAILHFVFIALSLIIIASQVSANGGWSLSTFTKLRNDFQLIE